MCACAEHCTNEQLCSLNNKSHKQGPRNGCGRYSGSFSFISATTVEKLFSISVPNFEGSTHKCVSVSSDLFLSFWCCHFFLPSESACLQIITLLLRYTNCLKKKKRDYDVIIFFRYVKCYISSKE